MSEIVMYHGEKVIPIAERQRSKAMDANATADKGKKNRHRNNVITIADWQRSNAEAAMREIVNGNGKPSYEVMTVLIYPRLKNNFFGKSTGDIDETRRIMKEAQKRGVR